MSWIVFPSSPITQVPPPHSHSRFQGCGDRGRGWKTWKGRRGYIPNYGGFPLWFPPTAAGVVVSFPRRRIRTPLVKMSVLAGLLHRHCVTHKHSLCSPTFTLLWRTTRYPEVNESLAATGVASDSCGETLGRFQSGREGPFFSGVGGSGEKGGPRDESPGLWMPAPGPRLWPWRKPGFGSDCSPGKVHFVNQSLVITRSERVWSCWVDGVGRGSGAPGDPQQELGSPQHEHVRAVKSQRYLPHVLCWPLQSGFIYKLQKFSLLHSFFPPFLHSISSPNGGRNLRAVSIQSQLEILQPVLSGTATFPFTWNAGLPLRFWPWPPEPSLVSYLRGALPRPPGAWLIMPGRGH